MVSAEAGPENLTSVRLSKFVKQPRRSCVMPTSLAFRTPVGGVSIPAGQSKELGSVDVHQFSKIRVVADERVGSPTGINIRLTITEGSELVAQLDTFSLAPHSQVTRVYDVPAKQLTVFADAVGGGGGNDGLDLLIYGNA
jgi:type III secretion protein HrpB1